MNLAAGEKLLQVIIASKAFGEITPGSMQIQQLELAVKLNKAGKIDAEMKIGYSRGTSVYNFPDMDSSALERARMVFLTFARATNQPGVYRNYDFSDCLSDEEMKFRMLLIPEYTAVAALPKDKVVSINDIKKALQCPVCKNPVINEGKKCPKCGIFHYRDKGQRYYKSERASFLPSVGADVEAEVYLCKIDYINMDSSYLFTHITYIEQPPIYLGGVYTITPQAKPVEFRVILNKPWGSKVNPSIFPVPYNCRLFQSSDLEVLRDLGAQLFCGSGTEPYFVVSFPVWDYTCLEEIGSHVNYLLGKYNRYLEQEEQQV